MGVRKFFLLLSVILGKLFCSRTIIVGAVPSCGGTSYSSAVAWGRTPKIALKPPSRFFSRVNRVIYGENRTFLLFIR